MEVKIHKAWCSYQLQATVRMLICNDIGISLPDMPSRHPSDDIQSGHMPSCFWAKYLRYVTWLKLFVLQKHPKCALLSSCSDGTDTGNWKKKIKKKILLYQAQSQGCKTTWKISFLPSFCLHFSHWSPALTSLLAFCLFGCLQQPALQQAMNWQAIWN